MRLLDAAQNLAADADLRLKGGDLSDVEELFRVLCGKFAAQTVAAHRNCADAAPFAVAYFEDFANQLLRRKISGLIEYARVLVLYDCASVFQLLDGHQDSFKNVQRLESGDYDRCFVAGADGKV